MYNCPTRWYTVVDEMSVDEMSVDELSWNLNFHVSLSCAFFFRMYISLLHHFFTSSKHSLFGLSLFVFPSISPNTTGSFTSLLSSILQMCPNKFNFLFLSLILCMVFLLLPILFLISSFVIFFVILYLE